MSTLAQHPRPIHRRAAHAPIAWLRLLVVLALGLLIDLGTKTWAFRTVAGSPVVLDRQEVLSNPSYNVPAHAPVHALPWGLLDFRLVINRGAVFGIGAEQQALFIGFTFIALIAGLLVFARMTTGGDRSAHIALGLILAGGIGNLVDRISFACVRDFLHMLPDWNLPFGLRWPGGSPEVFPWVFNIADVMLLTGMGLLMLHLNRAEHRRKKAASQALAAEPAATAAKADQPAGIGSGASLDT